MKVQAFLLKALIAFSSPLLVLIQILLLVPARVVLVFTLRECYPEISINELVDACINLTSFDANGN
jgi:hypothetical protein